MCCHKSSLPIHVKIGKNTINIYHKGAEGEERILVFFLAEAPRNQRFRDAKSAEEIKMGSEEGESLKISQKYSKFLCFLRFFGKTVRDYS
jgi:hypothetical protein